MKTLIYADNAATTQLDPEALDVILNILSNNYGNASQPYFYGIQSKKILQKSRKTIADCIGANPEEIYFTSGGTESNNWAIKNLFLNNKEPNLSAITSNIEHHSVLNSFKTLEDFGIQITYIPANQDGIINPKTFKDNIKKSNKLASFMFANNEIGSIQPIKELSEIAHQNNILIHTDAVQAIGHIKIDVHDLDVDFLSASAHKFNGPKGIGFLYCKKGTPLKAFINGGSQENNLRAGTENIALIAGMSKALENNIINLEANTRYINNLENLLLDQLTLEKIEFKRNGSTNHLPGLLSLSFKNQDGESLLHRLDLNGVAVSTGAACNSNDMEISHVLKAIKIPLEYLKGTIRISLGKYNTKEEIIKIKDILKKNLLI